MKAMPLPFEDFQGKGVLNFSSSSSSSSLNSPQNWNNNTNTLNTINTTSNSNTTSLITKKSSKDKNCYVGSEPTSVLDTRRSPSSPTSSSTLSSSLGGGSNGGGSHSTDTTPTGVAPAAAAAPVSDTNNTTTTNTTTANNNNNKSSVTTLLEREEKCGLGMEDWESVLSESPGGQEQSILRLIMADVDDPSLGLNKLLQTSTTTTTTGVSHSQDMEFNAGFGVVDDQGGYGFESSPNIIDPCSSSDFPFHNNNNNTPNVRLAQNSIPTLFSNNLLPVVSLSPVGFPHHHMESVVDAKPQIFNNHPPQMVMINQNQAQFSHNPTSALVMPLTYSHLQEHHHVVSPPPAKRLNTGVGVGVGGANFQVQQQQLQLLSHQIRPTTASMGVMKQKNGGGSATTTTSDEQLLVSQQPQPHQVVQQAITDQLSKAAELIETGNPVLAQGILARLNHQPSPLGKPFQRAAFYFKEALLLLLQSNNNNNPFASSSSSSSPFNLILKIGAYKTFSEISPVLQFANFTCNQAILEATEGFTRVHVIDFDIGYGGQWASFMQELALRNSSSGGAGNRAVSLKITAFASPSTHDEFELGFTQENLKHFASEINLAFELEILSLEMLNSGSWPLNLHASDNEALAVNLPIGSFSNYPISLPLVLRIVKQLSPKIVVSLERGCDRTDVPFSRQLVHALHSYSGLLESLDAVNVNLDTMQKIEKCLLQPGIEKIVLGRYRNSMLERMQLPPQPWRSAFLNSGFSPLAFSNFTESQAECLVQRTPVRGFHVEKKQSSSLVLCWQRKDLVSASAWRC